MPRVHHVKANKNYPEAGIKKGEKYYWWKFRFGGKRMSKKPPKASQLTQSEFLQNMYSAQEDVEAAVKEFREAVENNRDKALDNKEARDALVTALQDAQGNVEEWGQECEDKRSNMPDSLQDAPSGELLQTRYEQCQQIAQELDDAASEIDEMDDDTPVEDVIDKAEGINWEFE